MSASLVFWLFGATPALADDSPPQAPETGEEHHPTGRFTIGAGFSTEEHFIAAAEIAQDNLFGTGTQLSLTARISAMRQLFDLHIGHEHLLGTDWGVSTDLYLDKRVLPGLVREAAGFKTDISHPFGEHARAFVGYRLEHVQATDTLLTSARSIDGYLPPLGGGLISAVRGGIEWSNVDPLERRGARFGGTVEIADQALGSTYNLTRIRSFAEGHIPAGPFVLHLGGSVDRIIGYAPRSERIYLGMNDVRGYAAGSFGPINGLGQPVGGDLMLTGRVALELPIGHGLSLEGFYDAAKITDGGFGQTGMSVGAGIVWRSPIGNLRFDWAFPLDDPGGKPHFVFGM